MVIFLRPPMFAGTFYNSDPNILKKEIEASFRIKPRYVKKKIKAAIVPHAGYMYSGGVAAQVYSLMEKSNCVILGTNHSGMGSSFALMKRGLWKTPLGEVAIDEKIADRLIKESNLIEYDAIPHENEHSIEVQLPFLQYKFGDYFKFVPLIVLSEFPDKNLLENCKVVGKSIGKVLNEEKEEWIVLASSDFSHFMSQSMAEKIDKYAIKSILKMDEDKFIEAVNEKRASICGFGAIATAMAAAKEMGAKNAELLKYATSGDVTGEHHSVVGYAAIIFY
jgi:AmmeMemoRadiSam system protein B